MSAQPTSPHDEQTSDPQVVARLMAACNTSAVLPIATKRQRIIRAARASWRACRVR